MYSIEHVFKFSGNDGRAVTPAHRYLAKGSPCRINVQDEGKAATTLLLELHTYYLCQELIGQRLPDDRAEVFAWLRSIDGTVPEPSEEIRQELDEIYEDILSIEEYSLNRLTSYSDISMAQIMCGIRFSLACYMKMDRSRIGRHQVKPKFNSIMFNAGELKFVPCLPHNTEDYIGMNGAKSCDEVVSFLSQRNMDGLKDMVKLFETVHNTIDRNYSEQSLYIALIEKEKGEEWANRLLRECWSFSGTDQYEADEALVPLMELMDRLMEYCHEEEGLHYEADRDVEEMAMDILVPSSPLLSTIRPRNDVLDNCRKPVSGIIGRYDRCIIRDCMLFARILNNILAGSLFYEQGVAHKIYPKLNPPYMLRMLDSQLFGGRVFLPNMVFVTSDRDQFDRYRKYLTSLKFEEYPAPSGSGKKCKGDTIGYSYVRILKPLEKIDVVWEETGRSKAPRVRGSIGNIPLLSYMEPSVFRECDPNTFEKGTIIVSDRANKDMVIRSLRLATMKNKEGKKMVWRVVILSDEFSEEIGYTYMDELQNRIIEVGVNNHRQLLETHTNGILQRTRNALDTVMERLYHKYKVKMYDCIQLLSVLNRGEYIGLLEYEFVEYYNAIIDEISYMQGSRK